MGGLFDRLQDELGDPDDKGGVSALDLVDLPEELRRIMRQMLRQITMSYTELTEFIKTWPEDKQLTEADFQTALAALVKQGWLIEMGEGEIKNYRANLRRKKGSQLSDSIWNALTDRITERMQEAQEAKAEGGEAAEE